MTALWALPFALQGLTIFADEFIFHRRRGLAAFERFGHPLDTLSLLACLIFPLLSDFSEGALRVYTALAIFSSLLITKDEFIHARVCSGMEHWLHAILFLLHPIVLIVNGVLWYSFSPSNAGTVKAFFLFQCFAVAAFLFYQIYYWVFHRD